MAVIKALVVSLLLVLSAFAQDVGIDLLALQHRNFAFRETRNLLADEAVIGTLDWTFGTSLRPVKSLLITAHVKRLRVHLLNGPGLTNGQLGSYEPHFGLTNSSFNRLWERGGGKKLRSHLIERTRAYCALNVPELEISPTLEHHLTRVAFRRQARLVLRHCPRAVVVSNAGFGTRNVTGFKPEFHGIRSHVGKAPCNASLDGDSAMDVDVEKWLDKQKACDRFIWALPLNCRIAKGSFVDPRKRTACPTKFQLQELFELTKPLPPPSCESVPGCEGGLTKVNAPRLFKVWGDDHANGDPRANCPLWISPVKLPQVRLLACNGQEVARLGYYGVFDGGGYRYYSGLVGSDLYAIEMARKAEKLSGSPSVVVQEGKQCFGPFAPYLRQGYFRAG